MRKIDILHIVYHISIDTCLDTTKAPKIGAFVVYYRCYCPRLVTERGCIKMLEILISFTISIVAGITCHYICKWLDRY